MISLISRAYAAAVPTESTPDNPLKGRFESLGQVLAAIINIVFWVGIAFSIIFLIIGGIRYMTAGGDKAGVEGARGAITNAIIGFVVVIAAFAMRILVANILGATIPTEPVPTF